MSNNDCPQFLKYFDIVFNFMFGKPIFLCVMVLWNLMIYMAQAKVKQRNNNSPP